MISIPGRVVVLDYGEVISRSPSTEARAELAALAGLPVDEFTEAYERHRLELDGGRLSVVDYWQQMASELGVEWSLAHVQRLWTRDFTSWFEPEPDMIDLLVELHDGGTRLALLSNAGFDFGDPLRRTPFGTLMEKVYVSAELGLVKPDPEIYRHVLTDLGVEPGQTVFVDNKLVNVEGAESVGMTGHHFTGVERFRSFLEELAAAG